MIRLINKEDVKLISYLPVEVVTLASEILTVLDDEYGISRDFRADLGGYVIIADCATDLLKFSEDGIDLKTDIPEYVDIVKTKHGVRYTSSLILMNNDYGICLIMPLEITPYRLLEWVVK